MAPFLCLLKHRLPHCYPVDRIDQFFLGVSSRKVTNKNPEANGQRAASLEQENEGYEPIDTRHNAPNTTTTNPEVPDTSPADDDSISEAGSNSIYPEPYQPSCLEPNQPNPSPRSDPAYVELTEGSAGTLRSVSSQGSQSTAPSYAVPYQFRSLRK